MLLLLLQLSWEAPWWWSAVLLLATGRRLTVPTPLPRIAVHCPWSLCFSSSLVQLSQAAFTWSEPLLRQPESVLEAIGTEVVE